MNNHHDNLLLLAPLLYKVSRIWHLQSLFEYFHDDIHHIVIILPLHQRLSLYHLYHLYHLLFFGRYPPPAALAISERENTLDIARPVPDIVNCSTLVRTICSAICQNLLNLDFILTRRSSAWIFSDTFFLMSTC